MSEALQLDLSSSTPPADFSPPLKALWWLKKGYLKHGPEWERAHEICQSAEGELVHDWIHALCHLIEGDNGNAGYWFRRAGKTSHTNNAEQVWNEFASSLR